MNQRAGVPLLGLSCCEASRLASEALDRALTRRERWALRIHTCVCVGCRRFAAQIAAIRAAVAAMPPEWRQQLNHSTTRLSAERREKIKRLLADAMNADA